ncbi:MAG: NADPH-dependent FMN reductase [Gemmobacter sp.]
MTDHRLLGLCGALRAGSTNLKLLREAARIYAPTRFDEGDLRLPMYDGDLEADGVPEAVTRLAEAIKGADAVVIATPEYNKSISGVLKNALDWVSRVPGGVWRDKPVAIVSAAAGRAGGERAQYALRLCLNPFRPRVLAGPEVMVAASGEAFDAEGRLLDPLTVKGLTELMGALRGEVERGRIGG